MSLTESFLHYTAALLLFRQFLGRESYSERTEQFNGFCPGFIICGKLCKWVKKGQLEARRVQTGSKSNQLV